MNLENNLVESNHVYTREKNIVDSGRWLNFYMILQEDHAFGILYVLAQNLLH